MMSDLSPPRSVAAQVSRAFQVLIGKPRAPKTIYVVKALTGNLMFRIMFALRLQQLLPGSPISGVLIPEWNIRSRTMDRPKRAISSGTGHQVDLRDLATKIRTSDCDGVEIHCFAQRLEYFADRRSQFMKLFASPVAGAEILPNEIVFNIRAGDILEGTHPDYLPLPVSYYRELVKETGLRSVFIGQTSSNWYTDALHAALPNARWLQSESWLQDFQTIRNASVVAIPVSTFAWLASWLSPEATKIYLPVLGLFNPAQRPDVDLLPSGDRRYEFRPFPVLRYFATKEQKEWLVD